MKIIYLYSLEHIIIVNFKSNRRIFVQEKLGVARQGQVYALFDYVAENDDELSFQDGDLMTILRRGDNK